MTERESLMNSIRAYAFMLDELTLYLDTHPRCPNALAAFERYKALADAATATYEEKYGPITADSSAAAKGGCWTWVNNPWPWERGAN